MTKETEKTVHNPQKLGVVEKMDPTTGGTHSTVETGVKPKQSPKFHDGLDEGVSAPSLFVSIFRRTR